MRNEEEVPPWKLELIRRLRTKSQLASTTTTISSSSSSSGSSAATSRVHQPTSGAPDAEPSERCRGEAGAKMVQEAAVATWAGSDSDGSSEELKYGPGIVSKLKNRYLNLTLREAALKTRPSIASMRKAASLEHILEKEEPKREFQRRSVVGGQKLHVQAKRSKDHIKRARSVECISSSSCSSSGNEDNNVVIETKPKRESLHEDMLRVNNTTNKMMEENNEKNDVKVISNGLGAKMNRPKRLQPMLAEKEKPPPDHVKQTKMKFERPEQRTKSPIQTGEVAAKVATFKEIIETKKPPIKVKPTCLVTGNKQQQQVKQVTHAIPPIRSPVVSNDAPSPIPDVSCVEVQDLVENRKSSLSETPDLIRDSSQNLHQSPPPQPQVSSVSTTTNGCCSSSDEDVKKIPSNQQLGNNSMVFDFSAKPKVPNHLPLGNSQSKSKIKRTLPVSTSKIRHHQKAAPPSPLTVNVPINEPLKIEITTNDKPSQPTPPVITPNHKPSPPLLTSNHKPSQQPSPPPLLTSNHKSSQPPPPPLLTSNHKSSPPPPPPQPSLITPNHKPSQPLSPVPVPTNNKASDAVAPSRSRPLLRAADSVDIVKKKNLKNAAKNSEAAAMVAKAAPDPIKVAIKEADKSEPAPAAAVQKVAAKRAAPRRGADAAQNCLVFDFTRRKDVPDYVGNDGRIKTGKIEKPKPGEGGFTILPGATLDESFVDDDDEDWKKSLEGPPSPLLVTFVNDNVLINGKSSLSERTKKPKKRIQFVECEPDIFIYPSETSSGEENNHLGNNSVGHNVPILSGSSLANYKSKTSQQIEDFQLGVKPTQSEPKPKQSEVEDFEPSDNFQTEDYQPIAFSAGTNTDMLF